MHPIDLSTWNRAGHFHFFRALSHPHFSVTEPLPVAPGLSRARNMGISTYSVLIHAAMAAANSVPALRMRIRKEEVVCHDLVHPSYTVAKEGLFGFSHTPHENDLASFDRNRKRADLQAWMPQDPNPLENRDDLIFISAAPWSHFSSLTHVYGGMEDSIPRITFGKIENTGQGLRVPVAVQVHHALVFGQDVAAFYETMTRILSQV